MSDLSDAVARIQDLAQSLTGITIKSAPDYPIENVDPLPMVISYVGSGNFHAVNATTLKNFPVIHTEFHFSRVNLKQMAQQMTAVAFEFPKLLAGDPTLNSKVTTIVMDVGSPVPYESRPFEWGSVVTQMMLFAIPVKLLQAPT